MSTNLKLKLVGLVTLCRCALPRGRAAVATSPRAMGARALPVPAWAGIGAVTAAICLLLAAPSGATAAGPQGLSGKARDNHTSPHVKGRVSASLGPGTHYLYAQDGTCPDGIDVFKVSGRTLRHIQNVSAGCSVGSYYGSHNLAVVRTPTNCLIFDDGDGNVYSFSLTAKTGELRRSPASTVSVGGFPGDLAVSGSTVYESNSNDQNPSPTIDVFTVRSGCRLTLHSQNSTGSENDINIALANPTTVVSTDSSESGSGDIVAYTLQPDKTLAETVNDPGQIGSPDGVAVVGGNVYTGQATDDPPQTQGFSFDGTAFTPLEGSPQTSSGSAANGAAVVGSASNHLLAQADQYGSEIGWDNLAHGAMAYTNNTPLTGSGSEPTELTVAGDNLFVAQTNGGDVEDCTLAPNRVSRCHTVATLTGAGSGNGGSVAIFSKHSAR